MIDQSEAFLLRLPLEGPTGGSGLTSVDVLIVTLGETSGRVGWGLAYALGPGGRLMLEAAASLLADVVHGKPFESPEITWQSMAGTLNRIGRGIHYLAMAAIDMAAWDLHAKRLGVPLGVAMGGELRAVPVYGSGGFRPGMDPAAALGVAEKYAERGCTAIKLRMGATDHDETLLREVRRGLAEDIDIMVDVNEKADVERAMTLMTVCAEYQVLWIEEPLPAYDLEGYRKLAGHAPVGVATGEHLQGRWDFEPFVKEQLISIAQPDLAMMGGLSECLRTARYCESRDIRVAPHFLPSLFVHLAAATPAVAWLEDFPLLEPLFDDPVTIEDGRLAPRDVAGHGLTLLPDARGRYGVPS